MTTTNHNPTEQSEAAVDQAFTVRVRKLGRDDEFFPLIKPVTQIGTRDDNDILLIDEQSNDIAPYHAHILLKGRQVQVRALARLSRTRLGGMVLNPFEPADWLSIDTSGVTPQTVQIGPYTLDLLRTTRAEEKLETRRGASLPVAPAAAGFDSIAPGSLGITRASATEPLYLSPGRPVPYELYLHNRTGTRQTLRLDVQTDPRIARGWVRYPAELTIGAGRSLPIGFDIDVPPVSGSEPRRYKVAIEATARDDEALRASIDAHWIVLPFAAAPQLAVKVRKQQAGATIYDIVVTNTTNVFASYSLAAGDDDDLLVCSLQREQLALEPGRAATVELKVRPADQHANNRGVRLFVVELTPQGQDSVRRVVQFMPRRIVTPVVPRIAALWLVAALFIILIFVVAYLLQRGEEIAQSNASETQSSLNAIINTHAQQRAETLVAEQEATVRANIYATATAVASMVAPVQTQAAALNASTTAVSLRETNSADTVVAIASAASAAAIQVSTDQASAAQATAAFAQQVSNQSGTVVAGKQTADAQAAAPGQTVIAQATLQAISAQNATAAQAAANQASIASTSQAAGETAVVAATKQAEETNPVRMRFASKGWRDDTTPARGLGSVLVELLDGQGRISNRSGITIQLVLIGTNGRLDGPTAATTVNGVAIFTGLQITLENGETNTSFKLEASALYDGISKAQSRSVTVHNP